MSYEGQCDACGTRITTLGRDRPGMSRPCYCQSQDVIVCARCYRLMAEGEIAPLRLSCCDEAKRSEPA